MDEGQTPAQRVSTMGLKVIVNRDEAVQCLDELLEFFEAHAEGADDPHVLYTFTFRLASEGRASVIIKRAP